MSDLKKIIESDKSLVNLKDTTNHLFTPLFYATQINDTAKFNYACSRNNMELVELLLKNGANPNVRDKDNLKPIDNLKNKNDKQKMLDLMK